MPKACALSRQAVAQRAAIEAVLVVPKTLEHPFGLKLRRQMGRRGIPLWETTPELFLRLSRAEEPQWIGAIVRQRWEPLASVASSPGLCWVALDKVQSPGNLGTILRTGDAVGASGLILIGDSVDPYDPACVRATMGAIFAQRFVRASRRTSSPPGSARPASRCWSARRPTRKPTIGPSRTRREPCCSWVAKRRGCRRKCSDCATSRPIPMVGSSDSLNLAVATSVLLYEVFNQRRETENYGVSSAGLNVFAKP